MAKREFLQLAHVFKPEKFQSAGAFLSEKLDGTRAFWDGGVSRNLPKEDVPWSNMLKDRQSQRATGLWSRYGNVIHPPDWWLDRLPVHTLDGELWAGRGRFQWLRSVVARLPENRNDDDWKQITFKVFDIPNLSVFSEGVLNTPNFKKELPCSQQWVQKAGLYVPFAKGFQNVYNYLNKNLKESDTLRILEQRQLSFSTQMALEQINEELDALTSQGAEGLILRRPQSIWRPERVHEMVKVKPFDDSEGTVIGYKTARTGKLCGLIGALIVQWNGVTFELSGLTNEERVAQAGSERIDIKTMRHDDLVKALDVEPKAFSWIMANPSPENGEGIDIPDWIEAVEFPRGTSVTFKYRELSDDGIPKEARYWRKA